MHVSEAVEPDEAETLDSEQSSTSYPNSYWFSEFIAWYRDKGHNMSQDKVAEAGGPSRATQAAIEKRSAPVTESSIDKLVRAYKQLVDDADPLNVSLLRAAASCLRTPQPDTGRINDLIAMANNWSNTNQVFLGLKVDSEAIVHGHGVALFDEHTAEDDRETFRDFGTYSTLIAARQPNVVLVPVAHEEQIAERLLRNTWDKIKPEGERRYLGVSSRRAQAVQFDPIAGITSLEEAVARAEALDITGDDAFNLALVLLVANKRAAETRKPPIRLLDELFTAPSSLSVLQEIYAYFDIEPDTGALKALTLRALASWRNEYMLSRHTVQLDEPGKPLQYNVIHPGMADREQSLWFYDDARFAQLPQVLASQYTPALVLTPSSVRLYGLGDGDMLYNWLPANSGRCLLRDTLSNHWVAVDMPDSYLARKKSASDSGRAEDPQFC
ncbi:hypothetical protein BKG82_27150 [Mycobacteroides chelonae]|uniref:Uncharacterized protein n=1 Tax=Mycobacteroides chelonae TaxID=1774 RepID=A0A1S1LJ45_MYCCH|nr:hypothetical protein [Mycobacteroides chelonae]OHU47332.1 hypothetical protein BKG82_27150 [Mycobacteroides chelonae]